MAAIFEWQQPFGEIVFRPSSGEMEVIRFVIVEQVHFLVCKIIQNTWFLALIYISSVLVEICVQLLIRDAKNICD